MTDNDDSAHVTALNNNCTLCGDELGIDDNPQLVDVDLPGVDGDIPIHGCKACRGNIDTAEAPDGTECSFCHEAVGHEQDLTRAGARFPGWDDWNVVYICEEHVKRLLVWNEGRR